MEGGGDRAVTDPKGSEGWGREEGVARIARRLKDGLLDRRPVAAAAQREPRNPESLKKSLKALG